MTGPLKNPRHEAFIRHLLEGKTALDAYEAAGFVRDDANAARLRRNPKVEVRLTELQSEIAAKVPVTIEGLIAELEQARTQAAGKNQFAAAIKAILGKAQLSGLLVEKKQVEVSGSGGGAYDGLENIPDIAAAMIDDALRYRIEPYHDFRDEDRERLVKLCTEAMERVNWVIGEATEALIAEVRKRPLVSYRPLKVLPSLLNGKETEY